MGVIKKVLTITVLFLEIMFFYKIVFFFFFFLDEFIDLIQKQLSFEMFPQ